MADLTRDAVVSLREITAKTVRAVSLLEPSPSQKRFVAPNAFSIAQAYFHKEAWFRGIYADEQPVGFVMLEDWTRFPEDKDHLHRGEPYVGLWRFMIDGRWQGLGYGKRALELIIDHVRNECRVPQLLLSYVPGEGSPLPLYERFGFVPTGGMDEDEIIMCLRL